MEWEKDFLIIFIKGNKINGRYKLIRKEKSKDLWIMSKEKD